MRNAAITFCRKIKVAEDEVAEVEDLLRRKPGDLRRAVLQLLMGQKDAGVLESARRLLEKRNDMQQQAGLELLRLMVKGNRRVSECRELASAFAARGGPLPQDQQNMLNAILDVKQEAPRLSNALGLIDLSTRTRAGALRKPSIEIVTARAEALVGALDDFIMSTERRRFERGGEVRLLGEMTYGLGRPMPAKSAEEDVGNLPLQTFGGSGGAICRRR